jgi:hypothetical protein
MSPVKTHMLVTTRSNRHGTERSRLWPIAARIEWEWIDLRAFVPVADLGGFRSVQFNAGSSLGISSTDSRLQAIEACLSDWEHHLVTRFTW